MSERERVLLSGLRRALLLAASVIDNYLKEPAHSGQ
jgi:hypothetical protein